MNFRLMLSTRHVIFQMFTTILKRPRLYCTYFVSMDSKFFQHKAPIIGITDIDIFIFFVDFIIFVEIRLDERIDTFELVLLQLHLEFPFGKLTELIKNISRNHLRTIFILNKNYFFLINIKFFYMNKKKIK